MKIYLPLILAASLTLAACGGEQAAAPAAAPASAPAPAAPASAPAHDHGAASAASEAPAASAATASAPAAAAGECSITVSANDSMQYDIKDIRVPKSCADFTVTLKHTGTMDKAAMGHNIVIAAEGDVNGINADGAGAGAASGFIKAGDSRVIAATEMIGGGQESSVTFPVSKLAAGTSYKFFCTFPGHVAIMNGTIGVAE